jgi:hypothetical protein
VKKHFLSITVLLLISVYLIPKIFQYLTEAHRLKSIASIKDQTTLPVYGWVAENGYSWRELDFEKTGKAGFRKLSKQKTNIDFLNTIDAKKIQENRNLMNGSGVAIGDYDNDGLVDIYLCHLEGPNKLFKNLGNWRFVDVARYANVDLKKSLSSGAVFADVNGDNYLDLIVTSLIEHNSIFYNNGDGTFNNVSKRLNFEESKGSTTVAIADIDGDEDLDIYVTNYKEKSLKDSYAFTKLSPQDIFYPPSKNEEITSAVDVKNYLRVKDKYKDQLTYRLNPGGVELLEYGQNDFIYINKGDFDFDKIEIGSNRFMAEYPSKNMVIKDWGLTTRFQDIDNDGDPDIYVCNDFWTPDRIWVNNGEGKFSTLDNLEMRKSSSSTMSVDFSDIDRNGTIDFFVADMLSRDHKKKKTQMGLMSPTAVSIGKIDNRPQYMRNTLFFNRGDNTYAEIAHLAGLQGSEWTWSSIFLDIDLDGYEDLITTNGHMYDVQDADTQIKLSSERLGSLKEYQRQIFQYPVLKTSNLIFKNNGDLTFTNYSKEWGVSDADISHGAATGDLDNDGDLDMVINTFGSSVSVLENISDSPRIAVRLKGSGKNTKGIGSKIILKSEKFAQEKEIVAGGYYLSSLEPLAVFGLPDTSVNLTVEIKWRSGNQSIINNVKPNRLYVIDEDSSDKMDVASINHQGETLFNQVPNYINHRHHEDPYDDFSRQSLLPYRLSQLGPGLAWGDLDSDGDDDVAVPSGRGGNLSVFVNDDGNFNHIKTGISNHDQTGVLIVPSSSGPEILVGHSNFESDVREKSFIQGYRLEGKSLVKTRRISTNFSSVGALCMADVDGDGDLDLFAGGRSIPGRYPAPASSMLFVNENGIFVPDSINNVNLTDIGLITGAIFSDIDSDKDPDLILAMEWGPVTIFENSNGVFSNTTEEFGLSDHLGWWNGVATGDFNEDGQIDIVATNWGLNTKYHASKEHPLELYYDDFDGNGSIDIVEGHWDEGMGALVPERGFSCLSNGIKYLSKTIPTFAEFGGSDLREIIGPGLDGASRVRATVLEHMLFLNNGKGFESHALPIEAQFSPAFSAVVADMDNDGHDDIFLSQNFFAYQVETSRSDAGRGLWLSGDGAGNLRTVPGHKSGVLIHGEQRGTAVADINDDGRIDLLVSQNGANLALFKNQGRKKGIKIFLKGGSESPSFIGSKLQIKYEDRMGPIREIQLGSGYWSQNSWNQIIGLGEDAVSLIIEFPDGEIMEKQLADGETKVILSH